jgi:hypothetical protein
MSRRRIRSIKPEIVDDEKVGPLSDTAFRLFASMITMADDHGNVRADARWLQSQIWWAHQEPPNVLLALTELVSSRLIDVYGVRGGTYATLLGWSKHQRIDNAGKGVVPDRKDPDAKDICLESDSSPRFAADFREPPRLAAGSDRKGEEGERRGEDVEPARGGARKTKRRPCGFPEDWSPRPEERTRATDARLDCDREAERFRDHHVAKGSRMADWDAAFRTWLGNAQRWGIGRAPSKTPLEQQLERVRMLEEQERTDGGST